MHHLHGQFNHWAILVSAIILWMLGAAWYSPALFAKPWMALIQAQPDGKKNGLITGMIASFVGDLILAFVLAHVVMWSGASTAGWGAFVGTILWLGFVVAPGLPQGIYEGRPLKLFLINAGYWLVGLIGIGMLLAVWR
jgi:hypothetical protein